MNDTPTPRTTASRRINHFDKSLPKYIVDVEVAEQLERELAALTEDVGKCHDAIGEDRASDTSELWTFFESHKQIIHRLQRREDELEQERQDRKQAESDICRALGERNDARQQLAANHEATSLLSKWLEDERAIADRLAGELTPIAWVCGQDSPNSGEQALAAWKEARK